MTIRESFVFQHMCRALRSEPTWNVAMYCAFNDLDPVIEQELKSEYAKYTARCAQRRVELIVLQTTRRLTTGESDELLELNKRLEASDRSRLGGALADLDAFASDVASNSGSGGER